MKDGQSSSPQVNAFHEVQHFSQFLCSQVLSSLFHVIWKKRGLLRGIVTTRSVAELIDPLGEKVDSGIGLSYRPASPCTHVAWWADTTISCRSWLYHPSKGLWIRLLVINAGFTACFKICTKSHALAKTIRGFANFDQNIANSPPKDMRNNVYAKYSKHKISGRRTRITESGSKLSYMETNHICRMKLKCLTLSCPSPWSTCHILHRSMNTSNRPVLTSR